MATWTPASSEPLTTEREIRVRNVETGEEGYAKVSWESSGCGIPIIFGAVCKLDRVLDDEGFEIAEPKRTVLDANPTFA